MLYRNENTPFAKACWEAVDQAAQHAPEWVRAQIQQQAAAAREEMQRRLKRLERMLAKRQEPGRK